MGEPTDRTGGIRGEDEPARRHMAKGGWRRALIGFVLGAAAGLLAALVMPRDEGPARRLTPADRPRPFPED